MKKYLSLIFFILLMCSYGCLKKPKANITDEYVEVAEPGQTFGLARLKAMEFDSIFGYPVNAEFVESYSLVNRKTHKPLNEKANVKIYFKKRHSKYCWSVRKATSLAEVYYVDTIIIIPDTWYRLATDKYHFDIYFYLDGNKEKYKTILKPRPGAY